MKIFKVILSKLIISFIILLNVGVIFLVGCGDASKKYYDIDIYIQQKYLDKNIFGEKVYHSGKTADNFFPKYEQIKYNYSGIDFYLYDGTATATRTAITFVLDLKFSEKDEYESAKQNELSTREFMTEYEDKKWFENPVFEFDIGNFFCKTVDGNGYPRRVRLICLNDSNFILRYLILEEWESPEYVKDANYIKECTNCSWTS